VATPERVRLFVALELPSRVRSALASWRSSAVGDRDDLRLVAPSSLHVTLAFLGSRAVGELDAIAAAVVGACDGMPAARLRVAGVKPVPPRRPRLFALDLEDRDGGAAAVQAAVSDALAAGGRYKPEKRPFWPHVTLARVRKGGRVRRLEVPAPPGEPWLGVALTLYRSRLSRAGADYEPLQRVTLRR
jgi:2'-5' RNA ligase